MQSPSAETKDTSINVISQNKTFEKIPSNSNIESHDKLLVNSNSANSVNMKQQTDLNPIYERFKKEQDNVDFIKTLLKLKQKNNKTNYNFQIALYEKEPTTSPLLHDDENDLHSQAIYHNIPMAKTYKRDTNKKKTKSTSLDTNLKIDKSRNTNIKVHKTNSKAKHEKKFSLQPKVKKPSQICTVRLSSPSPTMRIQSPMKLNEIKKAYNTERKNIFGNKAIISFHNNGQKKFRSKRESSVPVTVINLFSENDIVVKTPQKSIKTDREMKGKKNKSAIKCNISTNNKNGYSFRKKTPVSSSKFQFIKKTKKKGNTTKNIIKII